MTSELSVHTVNVVTAVLELMPKIRALLQYTTQAWEQKRTPVAEREVSTLEQKHCTFVVQTSS